MSLLQSLTVKDCGHGYFVEQTNSGNRWCTADSIFRIIVTSGFGGVCYRELSDNAMNTPQLFKSRSPSITKTGLPRNTLS